MTPTEHRAEAQRLLAKAHTHDPNDGPEGSDTACICTPVPGGIHPMLGCPIHDALAGDPITPVTPTQDPT